MVFEVDSLTTEEVLATKLILETLECTHITVECANCPCNAICNFMDRLTDKCMDVLEEREFHDNH